MNVLPNFWRRLGITTKFGIAFAILLVLIVAVVVIGNVSLTLSNRESNEALESVEIQQLVSEINLELQEARVLEQNFFQQYPTIGVPEAREQYALPAVSKIADVVNRSRELRELIDESDSIGVQLRETDTDLNLFLSSAERNAEVFLKSVDLVSKLAAPETGLEAQLAQRAESVRAILETSEDHEWLDMYYEMRLAEGEYFQTRQRPNFQVAFNQATILSNEIEATSFDVETRSVVDLLEEYISIGEEIIATDVELQQTFNEFSLQTETVNPISEELIRLANLEVEASRDQIDETAAFTRALLVAVAVATILITLLTAYVLNNSITRNILRLTRTARELESGNLDARIQLASRDELGDLSNTLNGMAERLQTLIDTLEQRVAARTRDLEVAAEVSKEAVAVVDPEELLPRVVELTRNAFSLYYVSIFVYNQDDDILRLEAGTGEAGQRMKQMNKRFSLSSPQGLVPKAARERAPVVINNALDSPDHFKNPVLPDTQSEVALPMLVGEQLVGVIDLQSRQADRFSSDDLRVFQTLADRIAVSIRNAELFEETRLAKDEAEKANQVKSMFLASVSHELRTPLNSIINFTKFVVRGVMGPVTEKQVETLGNVVTSGEHLLALINDVLDISKIESGSLALYIEDDVNLYDLIETAEKTAKGLLEEKSVELKLDVEQDLPLISADRHRLLQILLNIVSNACKFTKEGEIGVVVKRTNGQIQVSVSDTGPGIPPEDQADVFEKFTQTEAGLRHGSGTGLGMPISRSLVEAHGGQLWMESQPGTGSTFSFTIPVQQEPAPDKEAV